jgi:hypothetical protein
MESGNKIGTDFDTKYDSDQVQDTSLSPGTILSHPTSTASKINELESFSFFCLKKKKKKKKRKLLFATLRQSDNGFSMF